MRKGTGAIATLLFIAELSSQHRGITTLAGETHYSSPPNVSTINTACGGTRLPSISADGILAHARFW